MPWPGVADADAALKAALAQEQFPDYRQLTVVDIQRQHRGALRGEQRWACTPTPRAIRRWPRATCCKDDEVIAELLAGYADSDAAAFEERLLDGLRAALAAGGEAGPVHSAGLLVVEDVPWPVTDLRVDYADDPIGDLAELWRLWKPQKDDYRVRGLDPTRAPSYGVPGDL